MKKKLVTYRYNLLILLRLDLDLCENKSLHVGHNLDSQKMYPATGIPHIICESRSAYNCSMVETITHYNREKENEK